MISVADYDFWANWSNVSPIEQKAINSTIKARELVIQSVPPDALVAIYIKGSFTRREMNNKSDVDMVPVVTETRFEGDIFGVNRPEINPVMVVPLSLEEFRTNSLATKSEQSIDLRAKPDRFLRTITSYKLIYGNPLNPKDFPVRHDNDAYQDDANILLNGYIPLYLKGEIDFGPLLKKFFWTVEMKLALQGITVPHTFIGIAEGARNDKLVQEALKHRQQVEITKEEELGFVKKLRTYLIIS